MPLCNILLSPSPCLFICPSLYMHFLVYSKKKNFCLAFLFLSFIAQRNRKKAVAVAAWTLPFVAELCHCLPRNPNTSCYLSLHMLSSCLAKIRDLLLKSLDAIPASLFSSTILYIQSSSFSVFFFAFCTV